MSVAAKRYPNPYTNPNPNPNPNPNSNPYSSPNPNPDSNPTPDQAAATRRFGWTQRTERRQMTESEGATKMQRGFRRYLKQKQAQSGDEP